MALDHPSGIDMMLDKPDQIKQPYNILLTKRWKVLHIAQYTTLNRLIITSITAQLAEAVEYTGYISAKR